LATENGDNLQGGGGDKEQQEEVRRQQDEMKNSILSQVLDQQARARCKQSIPRGDTSRVTIK